MLEMSEEQDTTQCFRKVSWFFTGKRFKESSWSWIVCVSSAVCNSINFGMTLSFGVLFPVLMDFFDETRERTAFVGSVGLGMVWFASPLAGYLCDRFGCRITCFLGGTLCIAGLVSTSFVQSLTVMYFTYSVLYGLGTCFIYNPCFLVIAKYFTKKLSVATGVVSLGASAGILYTGPVVQVLLDSFEWRSTFRIMAATFVFVCILSLSFNPVENLNTEEDSNEEVRDDKPGISLYCSVWSFPAYTVIVASLTFASFGWYIPFINLVKYCEDIGISAQKASQLFIIIGLASCASRLMTGRLCINKRINPVYIYQSCMVTAGIAVFLLAITTKYWSLIAFSVVYGLSDGVFITIKCLILLTVVDSKRTTAAFCIHNVVYSFSAAAGGPVAALIADHTGSYIYAFYMTGGVLFAASLIPVIMIFINWRKSKAHPQTSEVEENKARLTQEAQTEQEHIFGMETRKGTLTRKIRTSVSFTIAS